MQKVSIIIPAHNEATRIGKTLDHYCSFFKEREHPHEFIVVLNGCSDNTFEIVNQKQQQYGSIRIIDLVEGGKGLAIKAGFADALTRHDNELIGFVDADMATQPSYFYDLIIDTDGIIASRYMPQSKVYPPRPAIKKWGRIIIYESLIWVLFGMRYYDFQCGAKLFKRRVIETITPKLTVRQWAFDVELLYLCKLNKFTIKELPTVWYDQADSKLKLLAGGLPMLSALVKLRWHYSWLYNFFCPKKL